MYVMRQPQLEMMCSRVQRGYLSSRNTLLNSLFGEANNNNFAATMIWEWIAWNIDDRSYDFSVGQDGSSAQQVQINYMNSKVSASVQALEFSYMAWMAALHANSKGKGTRCKQTLACTCSLLVTPSTGARLHHMRQTEI